MNRTVLLVVLFALLANGIGLIGLGATAFAKPAAVFVVNDTADLTDDNGADGICHTASGTCTLRAAIVQANALGGAHTISLPAGVYTLALGELSVQSDVTINGAGAEVTIIDGNRQSRVSEVFGPAQVVLAGLTLRRGNAGNANGGGLANHGILLLRDSQVLSNTSQSGGGIVNDGALTLDHSSIMTNTVTDSGGGIYNTGALTLTASTIRDNAAKNNYSNYGGGIWNSGVLTVVNSVIDGNTAQNGYSSSGGGIWNSNWVSLRDSTVSNNTVTYDGTGGGISNGGTLLVDHSSIVRNAAYDPYGDGYGGGIITGNGTATISNSSILSNTARSYGGGIYNLNSGILTVTHSVFAGNQAGVHGGGLANDNYSTATLTDITFQNNSAGYTGGGVVHGVVGLGTSTMNLARVVFDGNSAMSGGGLANCSTLSMTEGWVMNNRASTNGGGIYSNGTTTITQSALTGNRADQGGGVVNYFNSLSMTNVTISGNTATGGGGGIYNDLDAALALTNVTVTANQNGGIRNYTNAPPNGHRVWLKNTIVAMNNSSPNCTGSIISLGYNLSSDNSCNLTALDDLINVSPLLGPLQNNGGATPTHALLWPSPAIDAGDKKACPMIDQRGVARLLDGFCDIGAFEYTGSPTTVLLSSFTANVVNPNLGVLALAGTTLLILATVGVLRALRLPFRRCP